MHIYNISYIIYMDIYLYIYVYLIYLKRGSQYIMEINMKQLGNQLRHQKRICRVYENSSTMPNIHISIW